MDIYVSDVLHIVTMDDIRNIKIAHPLDGIPLRIQFINEEFYLVLIKNRLVEMQFYISQGISLMIAERIHYYRTETVLRSLGSTTVTKGSKRVHMSTTSCTYSTNIYTYILCITTSIIFLTFL